MDALTSVALIGFLAQVLMWFALPETSREAPATISTAKPEAMAA